MARVLLCDGEKLRLGEIDYSNDPMEGKTLLSYLFNGKIEEKKIVRTYGVFAGCFSFDCDNLNQFRLYGDDKGEKGVGLSLVFRKIFFSEKVKLAIGQDEKEGGEKKLTLFRCVYFNTDTQRVETVGRLERNGSDDYEYSKYDKELNEIVLDVDKKIQEIKGLVQNLDQTVVAQLLINLRYLVKSVGFRYEQECRIVKICKFRGGTETVKEDDSHKLYIDYEPAVPEYVEKIYFGPNAAGQERFEDLLAFKGLMITCEKSTHPLAKSSE